MTRCPVRPPIALTAAALILFSSGCGTDEPDPAPDVPVEVTGPTFSSPPKQGVLSFRYLNQVRPGEGIARADLTPGSKVRVLPDQVLDDEFLDRQVAEKPDGTIYYNRTDISFDPKAPKICGATFTVVADESGSIRFAEPFPESMRNANNGWFPFRVEVLTADP